MANNNTIGQTRKNRIAKQMGKIMSAEIQNQASEMVKRVMEAADRIAKQNSLCDKDQIALRELAIETMIFEAKDEMAEACDNVNPYEI